jgi:hypothetical protein
MNLGRRTGKTPEGERTMAHEMKHTVSVAAVDGGLETADETQLLAHAEAKSEFRDGVVIGLDDFRAAALGRLQKMPALTDVLAAWSKQIASERCEDYAVDFRNLLLAPDGRIDIDFASPELTVSTGTDHWNGRGLIPMTYRVFGSTLRHYCPVPRNIAACLIRLPRAQDPHAHTARTMRATGPVSGDDSPRAIAVNAYYDMRKRSDQTVTNITGEPATTAIFRTRQLNRRDGKGELVSSPRTAIGVVSPDHCLRDGDDDKLIAALSLAFAGMMDGGRGRFYRGIEESELRAVFPALAVGLPTAGEETWHGYVTARNSESGAKSWSISAGLYREKDGASVACEAVIRYGRHVGRHVAERMVEVSEAAAVALKELCSKAAELAGRPWVGTEQKLLKTLRDALNGTELHDPDTCCGIAWALGEEMGRGRKLTVGLLMDVLGRSMTALPRRVDARPVEVMLGRVLTNGWDEFKAVNAETASDEEQFPVTVTVVG